MEIVKEKPKTFLEKHKEAIDAARAMAIVSVVGLGVFVIYEKIFIHAFRQGGFAGINAAIEWLNQEFPDMNVFDRIDAWRIANPAT